MRIAHSRWNSHRWSSWIAGVCAAVAAGACAFPDVSFSSVADGGTEQAPTLPQGSGSSGTDVAARGAGSGASGTPLHAAEDASAASSASSGMNDGSGGASGASADGTGAGSSGSTLSSGSASSASIASGSGSASSGSTASSGSATSGSPSGSGSATSGSPSASGSAGCVCTGGQSLYPTAIDCTTLAIGLNKGRTMKKCNGVSGFSDTALACEQLGTLVTCGAVTIAPGVAVCQTITTVPSAAQHCH